jgi:peptide/nickel transport system permease protein
MKTYIVKRLIQAVGVCLVISMISFFLLFLNTDPALLLLPPEAEMEDIAIFKKQMGLDRPVIVQYLDFLRKAVRHGDFGESFVAKIPAISLIAQR